MFLIAIAIFYAATVIWIGLADVAKAIKGSNELDDDWQDLEWDSVESLTAYNNAKNGG